MRKKPALTLGIAGLVLSAFVIMGCQDLLSEDKPVQTAKPPSEEVQVAAQEASAQEASSQASANTEPVEDLPAKADDAPKPASTETASDMPAKTDAPVTAEPTSTPAVPDNSPECKEIYAQMQTAMQTKQELLYMELKNKFGMLNCDHSKIANAVEPTAPVSAPECKEILAQMQTAKEPLYGELKNKFSALKCDFSQSSVPTVPPDYATLCKNYQASVAQMDPSDSKYASYKEQMTIYCTEAKAPAAPVATPATPAAPVASDNANECQDIYTQMQTAKDPLYGELKNKFGSLNCDHSKVVIPVVPATPDRATVCKNLRTTFSTLDPSSPKYAGYQQDIATYCTAYP